MSTSNAKTNAFEQIVIEGILKNTGVMAAGYTNLYLALFTAVSDGELSSVTEVSTSGTAYARATLAAASAWSAGGQNGSSQYEVSNAADISFTTATASWGTVTHFGIYTASSGGTLCYYGQLNASRAIGTNDQFRFLAGNLKIAEG